MNRIKLKDRVLPTYTRGEEILNTSSHIVGAFLGLVAMCLCIILASLHHNVYGIITGAVYGVTVILLYTMSSIYHGLKANTTAKKVFQIIDHCTIFVLIAGSHFTIKKITKKPPSPIILIIVSALLGMLFYGLL